MTPAPTPERASIVSGYFNPLHDGHLDMFQAARELTGHLVVIVNNDEQQLLKKGRIIQPATPRVRIVQELRCVDDVFLTTETGPGLDVTFDRIRAAYPDAELIFCNGGDRKDLDSLPAEEAAAAARNRIELRYGVGGAEKADSSTRIIAELDADAAGQPAQQPAQQPADQPVV